MRYKGAFALLAAIIGCLYNKMMRYAYLIYSLYFLGILGFILWQRKDLRAHAAPSIVVGAIAGPLSEHIYFRDYWRPQTLLGEGRISLEDALFGAAIFGLAAVLYSFIAKRSIHGGPGSLMRSLLSILPLAVIFGILWALGVNSVFTTIAVFMLGWAVLILRYPHTRTPSLITGGCLTLLALAIYVIALNLWIPEAAFRQGWLLYGTPLGVTVFGAVPLSELLWFMAAGLFLQAHFLYAHQKHYQPYSHSSNLKRFDTRDLSM